MEGVIIDYFLTFQSRFNSLILVYFTTKKMKNLIFTGLLFTLLFLSFNSHGQPTTKQAIKMDEKTIILDEEGKKVPMSEFAQRMNSGEWSVEPVMDNNGQLKHMQLRKSTADEKDLMAKFLKSQAPSEFVGKKAPSFSMTDMNGKTISSESLVGKVVVLNFWFVTCKPCIEEIPALNEVYKKYKNNPEVIFASITFNEKEKVNKFLKKHPLDYPVISDARNICNDFSVKSYPTNMVIDKDGNFYDLISGGFPNIGDHISNKIDGALTKSKSGNK